MERGGVQGEDERGKAGRRDGKETKGVGWMEGVEREEEERARGGEEERVTGGGVK